MRLSAEIIVIGDEVLGGYTIDTNSSWISQELNRCGIETRRKMTVSDTEESIVWALNAIHPDTKLVFITGGLGPTRDDRTKAIITRYFGGSLYLDETLLAALKERFARMNRPFIASNETQAWLPDNARIIPNRYGTAQGMIFQKGECRFIVMPGVPMEMKGIMSDTVLPEICQQQEEQYVEITLRTTGIFESALAERIEPIFEKFPAVKLGYYPGYRGVDLRLGQMVSDKDADIYKAKAELLADLKEFYYAENTTDITEVVAGLLNGRQWTMAVAESCTGGTLAQRITANPGASEYFREGIVTYSNEAKIKYLGVKPETLDQFGAVSAQVVTEMAEGMRRVSGADIVAAVSGIAGPDGGSDEKPVGLVYVAVATAERTIWREYRFFRRREQNIQFSAQAALNLVRMELLGLND